MRVSHSQYAKPLYCPVVRLAHGIPVNIGAQNAPSTQATGLNENLQTLARPDKCHLLLSGAPFLKCGKNIYT